MDVHILKRNLDLGPFSLRPKFWKIHYSFFHRTTDVLPLHNLKKIRFRALFIQKKQWWKKVGKNMKRALFNIHFFTGPRMYIF